MSVSITGKEWGIGELFEGKFVFRIPPYQRPYAWETEQARELFDDLDNALGSLQQNQMDDAPPYFLGSIVVIKEDARPDADVVDGQQRLTTLTILLAALHAEIADTEFCTQLRGLIYEPESKLKRTPARYRLSLRERDEEFFRKHIQNTGALDTLDTINEATLSDSQRNLVRNARVLRERVRGVTEDRRILLAQYLVARCFLVVVSTPTFDSAYRIFTVLNNRGLDLSHADVLKADVLGSIVREDEREAYADKWEQVEEDLGREAFRDLFSYLRTMFVRKKMERGVLTEVRDTIQPSKSPKWFVDDVLVPNARALDVIAGASYQSMGGAQRVNGTLKWLGRIDNIDWIPVALVVVTRWQASQAKLESALSALERLASVLMVGRADVNERLSRYSALFPILDKCGDDAQPFVQAATPTAVELAAARAVADGDLYLNKRVVAYVLVRLNAALAQWVDPGVDQNPSVEHVLPQTPAAGSEWLTWWPKDDERAAWTHRLGNLLLLTRRKNSDARNYDLDEKKKKYFAAKGGVTTFPLTTQVLQETTWTPAVVAKRQQDLMAVLEKTWTV